MKKNYIWNSIDKDKIDNLKSKKIDGKEYKKWKKLHKKKKRGKKLKRVKIPVKYNEYIKSIFWNERKIRYYQIHKRVCQACLSTKNIDLHHIVYGNFGNEKDEYLVCLCRDCHEEYHETYKIKGNMFKETNEFITLKRELLDFPRF